MSESHQGWFNIKWNGKDMIASPEFVKQTLLGVCDLKREIDVLKSRVKYLEKPIRQEHYLNLLRKETQPRTWVYIRNRVGSPDFWEFRELVNQGKIIETIKSPNHLFELKREAKP